jgi:CPA1 family monovalent cation:H+ antiporter
MTLLRGMVAFLLFAGALLVNLPRPPGRKRTIAALTMLHVVLSTAIVAALTWWVFQRAGVDIAFDLCLVFGALICPMVGESLFGAGLAVVLFLTILPAIGLSVDDPRVLTMDAALVIVVVAAGLWIGSRTSARVRRFAKVAAWLLTLVIFLMLGTEMLSAASRATLARGLLAIPIALLAWFVSRRLTSIATWSVPRGGLSMAMVLSLPPVPQRDLLLASTFAVVFFWLLASYRMTPRRTA